jgi:NhaP-type Na+/H+ or K+/H+ antiporter
MTELAIVAGAVFAYALVSGRLESTVVTAPMVFVTAGILLGPWGVDVIELGLDEGAVRTLAEATLVLLLFTDAIRIDVMRLRAQTDLPGRLLGLGLPLTVVFGAAVAMLLLDGLGVWEAALVAAILAPTDAALGRAVVTDPRVPVRLRQGLNVESGLNDGLMLPLITLFLALAASGVDLETPAFWTEFVAKQVGFGVVVGGVIGGCGGWLIDRFSERGWVEGTFRQLATLTVGIGAFAGADLIAGNGFVASFVAGLAFGAVAREHCQGAYDFAEDEGQLLALLTFFFFGAAIAGPALGELEWRVVAYAAASLTVVRIVPVALALLGTRFHGPSVLFLGWFGPRGLASILFGLFVLEQANLPMADEMFLVVTATVLLSIFAHGLSAVPASRRFGEWFSQHASGDMAEAAAVEEMPTR